MAEPAVSEVPPEDRVEELELGDPTVVCRGVHVRYRVNTDGTRRLRDLVGSGGKAGRTREIHAVRGIDLTAHEGESIGLIGRNGSGKSTLMQAIAGLLPVSEGEVYASSQPSLLGVSAALRPAATGRSNIVLGGLALGMSKAEVEARLEDTIEFTGLEEFIDYPIRTYSSGMRARLHFAIATMVEPEILLIDEALSTGDEVFKERSQARIEELLENAGTVFIVSHSLSTLRQMCTRVVWIDKGQVIEDGDPDEVVKHYRETVKTRKQRQQRKRRKQQKQAEQADPAAQEDDS